MKLTSMCLTSMNLIEVNLCLHNLYPWQIETEDPCDRIIFHRLLLMYFIITKLGLFPSFLFDPNIALW